MLVTEESFLQYPADMVLFNAKSTNFYQRILKKFFLAKTLCTIRNKYDVFHFNFGSSLFHYPSLNLPLLDLPAYPKTAKLVFTYNGCDARQKHSAMRRSRISACKHDNCYSGSCRSVNFDKQKCASIHKMDKYAHAIFALNPDLLYYLPDRARYLPYTIASWSDISPQCFLSFPRPFRIAHAPTNRVAKGSDAVFSAIAKLKRIYGEQNIVFNCIENMPHSEALKQYSKAHVVIDQLRTGWYGALAVESMRMGRPVIVYLRNADFHLIPASMANDCKTAFIQATEFNIVQVLQELIENPSLLDSYREAALDFVHRWHEPSSIAREVLKIYE